MRWMLIWGLIGTACVNPPTTCEPCGTAFPTAKTYARGAQLAAEECQQLCAACGQALSCFAKETNAITCIYAADCGETSVRGCNNSCDGCCDAAGACDARGAGCAGEACSTCLAADPACTVARCQTLSACNGRLFAEPDLSVCSADAGARLDGECVDACNALQAGAALTCAESACLADGGLGDCLPVEPTNACAQSCRQSRTTCEQACTASATCSSCSARCGTAHARCLRRC